MHFIGNKNGFNKIFDVIILNVYMKTPLSVPRILATFIMFLSHMPGVLFATDYLILITYFSQNLKMKSNNRETLRFFI